MTALRWALALVFVAAGALHLATPGFYDPAMPPWVPAPRVMIVVSGLAEIAGGAGLVQPSQRLRRAAGWGLTLLLVAVYPANVWMAMEGASPWLWARLPLQGVLVAAVLGVSRPLSGAG